MDIVTIILFSIAGLTTIGTIVYYVFFACKGCKNPKVIREVRITLGNGSGFLVHEKCNKCGEETYTAVFSHMSQKVSSYWAERFFEKYGVKRNE
jgi:hypothetical protein